MRYRGYLTLEGDSKHIAHSHPVVIVYASPKPGAGWINCNPAELEGAPDTFKIKAHETHAPEFHRQYMMVDPAHLRFSETTLDGKKALVLSAYNIPNVDPVVGMRRLNNIALSTSQKAGYARWAVVLKHQIDDPFEKELPDGGWLPEPIIKPMVHLASEADLHKINGNGQA